MFYNQPTMYRKAIFPLLGLIFAGLIVSTIWPVKRQVDRFPVQYIQSESEHSVNLIIDRPAYLRQGEMGRFSLNILVQSEDNQEVNLPLEARLVIPGIPARDRDIFTSIISGKSSAISWDVKTGSAGTFNGKMWLWVGGPEDRQLILAAPFEIDSRPVWPARAVGAAGMVLFGALSAAVLTGGRKSSEK